jgi:CheY-like chemotaxis protein
MSRRVAALGLAPRTASTAEEALQRLAAGRCELAVVQVMMPAGRNGLRLAKALRPDHPHDAVVPAAAAFLGFSPASEAD